MKIINAICFTFICIMPFLTSAQEVRFFTSNRVQLPPHPAEAPFLDGEEPSANDEAPIIEISIDGGEWIEMRMDGHQLLPKDDQDQIDLNGSQKMNMRVKTRDDTFNSDDVDLKYIDDTTFHLSMMGNIPENIVVSDKEFRFKNIQGLTTRYTTCMGSMTTVTCSFSGFGSAHMYLAGWSGVGLYMIGGGYVNEDYIRANFRNEIPYSSSEIKGGIGIVFFGTKASSYDAKSEVKLFDLFAVGGGAIGGGSFATTEFSY